MRLGPGLAALALVGLVALGGCRMKPKLDVTKTMTLEPDSYNHLAVDPVTVEQTVKVEFDAGGVPVGVYLVLGKDALAASTDEKALAAAKAKAENQAAGSVSATVPANEELRVYVKTGEKGATIKLKLTN
jgi:hypothetical protein